VKRTILSVLTGSHTERTTLVQRERERERNKGQPINGQLKRVLNKFFPEPAVLGYEKTPPISELFVICTFPSYFAAECVIQYRHRIKSRQVSEKSLRNQREYHARSNRCIWELERNSSTPSSHLKR